MIIGNIKMCFANLTQIFFTRLNGKALIMKKKTYEGLEERRSILEQSLEKGMMDGFQVRAKELHCMPDDIMDAVCLVVTAALKAHGNTRRFRKNLKWMLGGL